MTHEVSQSTETGTISCTVWVLGTVPSSALEWVRPSAPAIGSLLICMCPKARYWIHKLTFHRSPESSVALSPLQYSVLSVPVLCPNSCCLSLPRPSARLPQLRGSAGPCLDFPSPHRTLEALSSQHAGVVRGLTWFVFHFSASAVLHYLKSSVL